MDYSPPGSSLPEISQARILKWVAIFFSRGSSQTRDRLLHWQVDSFPLSHQGKPYIWIESSFSNQFSKCWSGCREKVTLLYCWWECKLVQPLSRTVWRFLKKLEIELPYDPAIPLLGIHTEETRSERDTCTPMFIAALFIIAGTWKQPTRPTADEWIRKLWYIYTMEYYSAIKKNSFESVLMRGMKLEPIIQSEVSQKEKYQYSILTPIYGI